MVSVKTICAYLSYALVTTVFFLYLCFPEPAVIAYLDSRLTNIDASLSMDMETIRPAIPPGLEMTGLNLNRDEIRLAHFDTVRLLPDLSTLLRDNKQARFQAQLADGTVNGRAVMEGNGPTGSVHLEADLEQIRLEDLDAVKAVTDVTLSGLLKGRMTHDGGRAPGAVTNGALTAAPLQITLKAPFFGITQLVVDQADTEFSISGRTLRLKRLNFDGPMIEGRITGTIVLAHPLGQSQLNLTGNTKPKPELLARLQETLPAGIVNIRTLGNRGLTFQVRGDIDSPDISMR